MSIIYLEKQLYRLCQEIVGMNEEWDPHILGVYKRGVLMREKRQSSAMEKKIIV